MKTAVMDREGEAARHVAAPASPNEGVVSAIAPAGPGGPAGPVLAAVSATALDADDAAIDADLARGAYRAALDRIDAVHGDALYRFIRSMMGSDDRADDLYQVTMIAAFRDLATFGGRSSVRTWLFGIARHRCLDALKLERRHDARFAATDEVPEIADDGPAPDRVLTDGELLAALEQCLGRLPAEVRMVLVLRFQEGFAYDDIARITQLRLETLRARVSRAMPVLRRCIESRGAV